MSVAETILAQLGGRRFVAMTGASSFASSGDSLSFRIPRAKRGISAAIIKLTPDDLYTVTFFARKPFPACVAKISEHEGIYFDQLCDVFESETGLRVSL